MNVPPLKVVTTDPERGLAFARLTFQWAFGAEASTKTTTASVSSLLLESSEAGKLLNPDVLDFAT